MTKPGAQIEKVMPFSLNVSRGMTGISHINKFGHNPDIDVLTVPEDVWDYGGVYTFSAVATTYYISSSDNTDTQTVNIQTLTEDADGDWNIDVTDVVLSGQTPVPIVTTSGDLPIRFFRGYNAGTTVMGGDVYVYETDTTTGGIPDTATKVRGMITQGEGQTEMAIYTIPSGKVGYLDNWYALLTNSKNTYAVVELRIRNLGRVFRIQARAAVDNGANDAYVRNYKYPLKLSAKTDIIVRVTEVGANDTAVASDFDLLLEDIE